MKKVLFCLIILFLSGNALFAAFYTSAGDYIQIKIKSNKAGSTVTAISTTTSAHKFK